jgi:hypothetical protein
MRVAAALLTAALVVAGGSVAQAAEVAAPTHQPASAPLALAPPQGPLAQTGCVITGTDAACDLWAKTGSLVLPGGSSVPIWGFASTSSAGATLPGPVLVVNQGDHVTITVHNGLATNLALALPAVTGLVPDLDGAAPGAAATYSFTATRPGTYLYEAGHTNDGLRQAAMGLVGALVVRAADVGGRHTAYGDAGSAYDDEAVLVLTEVDPAFNANPVGYDLRSFSPRYRLINGKAFPETDPVATDVGRTVLLRYVNAGLVEHPMMTLGVDQSVVGRDSRSAAYPSGMVTVPTQPGQTVDTVVTMPAGPDGARFALMETVGQLNNNGQRNGTVVTGVSPQQAFGGMLTFLDTNPGPASGDHVGPATTHVVVAPNPASVLKPVTVTADISDVGRGGSIVDAGEIVIDDLSVAEGTGYALTSAAFGTGPTVTAATASIPTSVLTTLTQGNHTIYARGHDAAGNWGVVGSATLTLSVTGPVTNGVALAPNPTMGTTSVSLSSTGDDTGLGGTITAAEYYVDATGASGGGIALTVAGSSAVAPETVTIPAMTVAALPEGKHTVYVHSKDSFTLWGPYASLDLVVDRTAPTLVSASVTPAITDGTNGSPSDPTDLRVNTSFTDPTNGGVNTTIAGAEGFVDTAGTNGTGLVFLAADGTFGNQTESAYGLVPLSEVTALADGVHRILVHAKDKAGNWGPLVPVTFTVDRFGPTVSGLSATPNPVSVTAPLSLSATATDVSAIAAAEWFDGTDPGVGNGKPMTVTGTTLTATIAAKALSVGTHTLRVRAKDALGHWGAAAAVTVTVTDLIFADAFDSANTSRWSQTVQSSGTASAATTALVVSGASYVVDNTPAAERTFFAKFDLTLGSYNPGSATVDIFQGRDAASSAVVIQLHRQGNNNQVRLGILRSNGWTYSNWTNVSTSLNTLRLSWSSGTSGTATLRVGTTQIGSLTGNTSGYVIESAAMGLVLRSNTTSSGSATFDNYVSNHTTAP